MRVRTLHLRNFRRHADTRVEFPDGVTAVLGANGAGKSSLLEGIAFALFGTDGLRTGKSLVRLDGAPPGDSVEATLELELGGQALVLHRELKGKALAPSASLTVDGALVVPAGAGSSEAVTQQVSKRLGMGPDAFFTTIVARQGELARLANQSPADRKRLVLRMVGVDRIDAAIEQARDQRRQAQAGLDALRRLAQDPVVAQANLERAQGEVAEADTQAAQATLAWQAAQRACDEAARTVGGLERQAEARRAAVVHAEAARRAAQQAHAVRARAEADLQLALAAQQAAAALEPEALRLPALQLQWQEAQRALALARQRALQEQAVARLEADLGLAHQGLLAAQAAATGPEPPGLDISEVDVEAAQGDVATARARLVAARGSLAQAQERRRRLAALGQDAPCPTCERPLGEQLQQMAAHTHDAASRADDEVAAALAAEGQAAQRLTEARARRERAAEATRRRERSEADLRAATARVADLGLRLDEARVHLPPPTPAPAGIEQLRADLAGAQRAHDERQRHAGLADRAPALQVPARQAAAASAAALLELEAAEARLAALPDGAVELTSARAAAAACLAAERAAERAVLDGQRRAALAAASRRHAEALVQEQRRIAKEVAGADGDVREWTALTDGGRGLLERFRDHVVDRIGPAIQVEASRLLAAFTGGRYTELLLDTQYNVYVTDSGVPYTLDRFSGGEQDLAHLALRLAVSRLLAERSGAAEVRLLALDEVFGSLDLQRRDLVVGALHGLSGLYSQVLVVSHQEALQEALDRVIVVEDDGGTARVHIQNG